ncbi:hypothetical protein HF313_10080 [Massilia atriviolacea]|uniref:Uncharacterized protein n=1 Tax=Massilia atriviolacea TaxID=2495579 RepID=A0A430HI53_9BURK|nr:hypothetical protein [Massilia atriviolacea]RSZ57193.1 hypothetical protein EJB06_20970 [Massilia atriviolacea]
MTPFIERARENECAEYVNRLYVIDGKYVTSETYGRCFGRARRNTLYAATSTAVLCSDYPTFAEKASDCADPSAFPLFFSMFGWSGERFSGQRQEVFFLPKDGSRMALEPLTKDTMSGIQAPRQQVIRDAATFAVVWAEHNAGRPAPAPLPTVRFDNEMVLALFGGAGGGCRSVGLRSVRVSGGKLVAAYAQGDFSARGTACPAIANAPMEMVVLDRQDAPVVFEAVVPDDVPFTEVPIRAERTGVAKQLVIKDAQALTALWKELPETVPMPTVDFSKQMAVAVFLRDQSDSRFFVDIGHIERLNGKLRVTVHVGLAGRYNQAIPHTGGVFPTTMVLLDRSDEPVEFVEQLVRTR